VDQKSAGGALGLANEAFLAAEYATVVLPHRITSPNDYLKVRPKTIP